MNEMLCVLKTGGYKQASLSVQKANYAAAMYQKTGKASCNTETAYLILGHFKYIFEVEQ